MSNADTALEHAINTTGDYIGVVLSKAGTWSAFPFPTRATLGDWYGDWVGNPTEFSFLAAYDKHAPQWNDGIAVTSVGNFFGGQNDAAMLGAAIGDELGVASPLRRLAEIIAVHEIYWARVAQQNARSATMRTFVRDVWDPFYARYTDLAMSHGLSDVDIDVVAGLAGELDNIRSLARSRAIPVPDIVSSSRPAIVSSGVSMPNQYGRGRGGRFGGAKAYIGADSDVRSPTSTSSEVRSPTSTSTEVRSPTSTSTEVRSPTSTSTDAYTQGNVTVTGGAGAGATTVHIHGSARPEEQRADYAANLERSQGSAWRPETLMYETGAPRPAQVNSTMNADQERRAHSPIPDMMDAVSSDRAPSPMQHMVSGGGRGGGGGGRGRGGGGFRAYPTPPRERGGFRGPGARYAPPARPFHPGGVHGHGGFYRHGSRFPGRWRHGYDGQPEWYEGNDYIYDQGDDDFADMPPPSTDDQPIAPEAQGAAPADAGAGDYSGDSSDPNDSGDSGADDQGSGDQGSATVASGWFASGRRMNDGNRVPSLVELANLISPNVGAKITLSLDGDILTAIVQTNGKAYQGTADMSAVLGQLDSRADKRIEAFYRALTAPKALVGISPLLGGSADHDGQPVIVGGGCGVRSYANVGLGAIKLILQRLNNKGATVTGSEKDGWYVITNRHGVEFKGTWNKDASTIDLEVTDSDFAVPCSAVWNEIESMLSEIGVTPVAVLDTSPTFDAVRAAGHALVGCLLDQHAVNTSGEVLAGWGFLGDIGNAIEGAGKGIGKGFMWTQHESALVVQKLKTPITIAATAVATVYGGPVAGAAAAKLMGPLIDSQVAVGDKISGKKVNWDSSPDTSDADAAAAKQQAGQAVIAAAAQAAKSNPTIAKALGSAQKALAHTVAAYQTADTVQKAAAGDPNAQAQVGQLKQAAAGGNTGASSLMSIASKALGSYFDDRSSNPQSVMSTDYQVDESAISIDDSAVASSGNYAANVFPVNAAMRLHTLMGVDPIVRAHNSGAMLRAHAAHGVHDRALREGDGIYGALLDPRGTWSFSRYATLDEADDWMGYYTNQPDSFVYVGYFDTTDPMWPHPVNDASNPKHAAHDAHDPAISSGWIAPLLAATGGFAAGMYGPDLYRWTRRQWAERKGAANPAATK